MSTETLTREDALLETGEPRHSHVVPPKDGKTGAERVMEARILGTPVTALCGYTWVPERDPQKYPQCPKCLEILDGLVDDPEGVPLS